MPETYDSRDLALLRLVAQGVVGPGSGSPEEVMQRLLCLQAQDYWSGVASVALRSTSGVSGVEAALDSGSLVRAWPLRGTLHLVAAKDLSWLRLLLAKRELAGAAAREAKLGITSRVLGRAEKIAVELISDKGPCSRAELTAAWRARKIETTGLRSYHLIWHLAHTGTLCFGPVRKGQQLLVLTEAWIPASHGPTGDDALEALARRYFEGHGPATTGDLARWANLPITQARSAVVMARQDLSSITVAGVEYLAGSRTQDELAECRKEAKGVAVLPSFDEMLFGYKDRTPTLPADRSSRVWGNGNGVGSCTVIVGGEVVATWKRPTNRATAEVEITPLVPVSKQVLLSAAQKASALI